MKWQKTGKLLPITHGNGCRKHEKHEFLRRLSNHVSVVTVARNHLGNLKKRAIAHEIDRKQENCQLYNKKMEAKNEKHEFLRRLSNHVSVVTVARNRLGNRKKRTIAHEMDRKQENCEL